jgi:hypothetical protein
MTVQLSKELADALRATDDHELELIDPETHRRYVLVDSETHLLAMRALQRQQDLDAIARGLREMEAGGGEPLEQAFADIRRRLNLPRP